MNGSPVPEPSEVKSQPVGADGLAVALTAARAADSMKGESPVVVDVSGILGICDYFVICSAPNTRLVGAIAQEIEDHVAIEFDRRPRAVEGLDDRRWVLVDFGDVVVHIFINEERSYYRLERLYGDAPRIEWAAQDAVDTAVS